MELKRKLEKNSTLVYVSLLLISAIFFVSAFYFHDKLVQFQQLGLLGIFLINFFASATLFLPAPAFISVIAGGTLFSPPLVALLASLGSTLGDMLGFAFGVSGRHLAKRKTKRIWFGVLQHYFKRFGGVLIFLFAIIPNPVFDSIGIVAGLFAYPPKRFFIIVFVGRFLRYLVLAYFGSHI